MTTSNKKSIFSTRNYYKPFDYPEFFEGWSKQQSMFWTQFEIPMVQDKYQFYNVITKDEQEMLTLILRFFTQADVEVSKGYMALLPKFELYEIKAMMLSFANMETIHSAAYAYLVDELGLPESIFSDFIDFEETRQKYEYLNNYKTDTNKDLLKTIAMFSGFVEGVALFSSFCMLVNLSRFGLMGGIGQISTFSMRDENLHNAYMTLLFVEAYKELRTDVDHDTFEKEIQKICMDVLRLEELFIDLVFHNKTMRGITAENVKSYVRRVSILRINALGFKTPDGLTYDKEQYPKWMDEMVNLREMVDFFANRSTEYVKSTEKWEDV